ncbi:hypothetical protein POKO110462_16510 [Pontibacter korlensis]
MIEQIWDYMKKSPKESGNIEQVIQISKYLLHRKLNERCF